MAQQIILVSTIVDNTIKDYFKDVDLLLFNDLTDLTRHVESTPVRCTKFIVTSDVTDVATTSTFHLVIELIKPANKFFLAEEFVFVAPDGSPSLPVLDFVVQTDTEGIPTPTILKGTLSREFLISIIRGTYRDSSPSTTVNVVRRRRDEVIREQLAQKRRQTGDAGSLDYEKIETEADRLAEVPDQKIEDYLPTRTDNIAKTIQIVGGEERGKTTFALVLAQYIAKQHKVVVVENDFEYFALSNAIELSGVDCEKVSIEEFYKNPTVAANRILNCGKNLVAVVGESKFRNRRYSHSFITRLCASVLSYSCDYIILENSIQDMMPTIKSVLVLNNEVIPILKDVNKIPHRIKNMDFVALSTSSVRQTQITSSTELTKLLSELLNMVIQNPIPIYRIESYEIGAIVYDLHRYM